MTIFKFNLHIIKMPGNANDTVVYLSHRRTRVFRKNDGTRVFDLIILVDTIYIECTPNYFFLLTWKPCSLQARVHPKESV